MKSAVLVDTGAIIAFFRRDDKYHLWATERFKECAYPLLTCEAVISEACFLLSQHPAALQNFFQFLKMGYIKPYFNLEPHLQTVIHLIEKYRQVPMSLADACLVRMSELHPKSNVLTLDSDFTIYRRNGRNVIPLITPAK